MDRTSDVRGRAPRLTVGAAVAVGLAVALLGLLGWFFVVRETGGSSSARSGARDRHSVAASVADLRALVQIVQHPVYWAGPQPNDTYELTRTEHGRIYIRYLPRGVQVGDPNPKYTTVGTYPVVNAYGVLQAALRREGATGYHTRSGALAIVNSKKPTSVYFAFPQLQFLVEVFDPSASRALQLVLSGQIKLVS